jgi:CHRD domain
MRRVRSLMVGTAVAVAAIAVGETSPVAADHSLRALGTIMTGPQEVPGPGDEDGVGAAGVLINVTRGRICYLLAVKNIATPNAAHIHIGAAGTFGGIVVNLDPPVRGFSANCTNVGSELAGQIAHAPEQYYVNVHNAEFPAGAIRGQLG